jgi:4-diphosphocytidyl-2-C-methyl-D-erythritol kinase
MALKALMRLDLGKGQLEAVAARLGSDLSFFFHEPSAACRGRGELVEPIARPLPGWGVLVLPGVMMPTPAVYRRFDELGLGEDVEAEKIDWAGWAKLRSKELLERLVNDLEKPAFSIDPKLGKLREDVERVAGRIVRMSGSGSSLFTVFDEEEEATKAAGRVAEELKVRAIAVEIAPKIRDDLHGNLATR